MANSQFSMNQISMRFAFFLLLFVLALTPNRLSAQQADKKAPIAEIKMTRIGFMSSDPIDPQGRYKVGMWTPVYLKIKAGPKGIHAKGPNEPEPYIQVENEDNENVGTIYRTPFKMEPNEERWITTYAKPGQASDIKIRVVIGDFSPPLPLAQSHGALDLNTHLYVSLGKRIPDLQPALVAMVPQNRQNQNIQGGIQDTRPRYAGFEAEVSELPEYWFGYQGVDLLILSTGDKEFLLELAKDNDVSRARLKAIAQYVRRGGRLVIPVSHRTTDVLAQLLQSTVWQPPISVVPPKEGAFEVKRLAAIENFAGVQNVAPFPAGKIAQLAPVKMLPGAWEVLKSDDPARDTGKPLIARMPYGLGSITFLAFPLDEAPFTTWNGKVPFLKNLLPLLAPRVNQNDPNDQRGVNDLSTDLQRTLDNFDVRVIPFGYVALFIVLYIVVVGPLDFLVLKYIFKRLEWTWFTFPTVVLAVSVAAYFTAYAIKGNDLKINKVDIIDIDQRTNLDSKGNTKKAFACGQTLFTILSPRIQNYTIGVEANSLFWGQAAEKPISADMVTWLGRADRDQPGGMGRAGGGQSFFRKPYRYDADASGLLDVPIPVWTTKSFHASWEALNIPPPIHAELNYPTRDQDPHLTGVLKNGLAVDLDDAWIFYFDKAYPIEGGLPRGAEIKISLESTKGKGVAEWSTGSRDGDRPQTAQGLYNPSNLVRTILFSERLNPANNVPNHSLRTLDLSWRSRQKDVLQQRDNVIREAILVARVKFALGPTELLTASVNNPLPTNLWMGELPGDKKTRPPLAGTLAQDTFVRVLLPVRPKE
jgi:hypothetical protein